MSSMNQTKQRETPPARALPVSLRWLRQIDADTAQQIVELINSTVEDGGTLGYERVMTPEQGVEFSLSLQSRLQEGGTHALLGSNGYEPVCFVMLSQSGMPNCRHIGNLSKGVVHPRHRGHGVVPRAFREIVVMARTLGIELLTLDVREGSRAHRLWSTLGFASFGVLNDYARVNGVSHRGHYMMQRVDDLAARLNAL